MSRLPSYETWHPLASTVSHSYSKEFRLEFADGIQEGRRILLLPPPVKAYSLVLGFQRN